MSDPLDALRLRGPEEVPVHHLPADEVRRRGDTRRRRRTALQGAAATLAVVAVVGGVAYGTGAVDRTAPEPPPASQAPTPEATKPAEPSPSEAVERPMVTAIPPDFPLTLGYPEDSGLDQELQGPGPDVEAFSEMTACDRALDDVPSADRLAATFAQPEDFRSRALTTYPSEADAATQLAHVVMLHEACPRETYPGAPDTMIEVEPGGLGEESYTIARHWELDGSYLPGVEVIVAVRVGNAVLLSSESNEGGGSAASVRASRRHSEQQAMGVVDAMCLFGTGGCATTDPVGTEALLSRADVDQVTGLATDWSGPDPTYSGDACWQVVPVSALGKGAAWLRYEGHGRDDADVVNARVVTAVTPHGSPAAAMDTFDASREEIAACGGADQEVAAQEGDTTYWRMIARPAPEVCTQCGAAWLHAVGVAVVGNRLVAVNVSWIGDLEMIAGAEDPGPVSALLDRAVQRASRG